jgi:hypothetical protein
MGHEYHDSVVVHNKHLQRQTAGIVHHDSARVPPNIFGLNVSDTKTLNAAMLEKLDWWI